MAEVVWWILRHRVHGAGDTFMTRAEAEDALRRVVADEPGWEPELFVEPFALGPSEPVAELAR